MCVLNLALVVDINSFIQIISLELNNDKDNTTWILFFNLIEYNLVSKEIVVHTFEFYFFNF